MEAPTSPPRMHSLSLVYATNHAGWQVEYFDHERGWLPVSDTPPYATREQAVARMGILQVMAWRLEYRVYEALKP